MKAHQSTLNDLVKFNRKVHIYLEKDKIDPRIVRDAISMLTPLAEAYLSPDSELMKSMKDLEELASDKLKRENQ